MNKIVLGLLLGAVLGAIDGLTALLSGSPEVAAQIGMIVVFSTLKGLIAGVLIGWFAQKVRSLPLGILFGFAVGLILAWIIAAMPSEDGKHYYLEIMVPGSLVGLIVGYATQRYGRTSRRTAGVRPRFPATRADGSA
jgi:MFS family permease